MKEKIIEILKSINVESVELSMVTKNMMK